MDVDTALRDYDFFAAPANCFPPQRRGMQKSTRWRGSGTDA
jgi:hypothetical protein